MTDTEKTNKVVENRIPPLPIRSDVRELDFVVALLKIAETGDTNPDTLRNLLIDPNGKKMTARQGIFLYRELAKTIQQLDPGLWTQEAARAELLERLRTRERNAAAHAPKLNRPDIVLEKKLREW